MSRIRTTAAALTLAAAAIFAAPASVQAELAVYEIDGSHSRVLWKIFHMNVADFYGRFNDVSGKVVLDDADPSKNSVEITIKADSIDSGNEKRDQHIKGPDFLNAKQFPEITLKSTKVSKVDDKTYSVDANLTLHGVNKPVSFKFTLTGTTKHPRSGKEIAGGRTEFTFKRSDFGINYMLQGLSDEITVIASVEGERQ